MVSPAVHAGLGSCWGWGQPCSRQGILHFKRHFMSSRCFNIPDVCTVSNECKEQLLETYLIAAAKDSCMQITLIILQHVCDAPYIWLFLSWKVKLESSHICWLLVTPTPTSKFSVTWALIKFLSTTYFLSFTAGFDFTHWNLHFFLSQNPQTSCKSPLQGAEITDILQWWCLWVLVELYFWLCGK